MLKEQRLAATGHLGHAIGDLGDLQMDLHRLGYAMQFAGTFNGDDEVRQRIEGHQRGGIGERIGIGWGIRPSPHEWRQSRRSAAAM